MKTRHLKSVFVVFGFLLSFLTVPVSAVSTSKTGANYYVDNGSGNANWHSQGATMTKDYWIWTDWQKPSGPTYIVMCQRSNPSNCTRSGKKDYDHASTLYHKWGTDYFLVKAVSDVKACWSISKKAEVSKSECNTLINEFKIGDHLSTYNVPQGYTRYGDYFLRGYGNSQYPNYIVLYTSKYKKLKDVKLPSWVNEIEDVMVDGATGEVYFSTLQYIGAKKQVQFHKLAKGTFDQWIKPGAGGDGGGTYVDPTSNPDDFYDDSNIEVRDETKQHETATSSYDGSVDTNFFGPLQDDNEGCGVYMVLNTIIDILTYGIAIAATIGIAISGIVYLNSKGDQQRTLKAKRRIYEIVIGLAAYAVLYFALGFLLPGGNFNPDKTCEKASETSNAVAGWHPNSGSDSNSSSGKKPNAQSTKEKTEAAKQAAEDAKNGTSAAGRRLMTAAEELAGKLEANKFVYSKKNQSTYAKALKKDKHVDCAKYVSWAMQSAGLLKSGKTFYLQNGVIKGSGKSAVTNNKKLKITKVNDNVANLVKKGKLVPGDIIGPDYLHTLIYKGKENGKYYYYSVGTGTTKKGIMNKKKITNKTYGKNGKYRIKIIIHPI